MERRLRLGLQELRRRRAVRHRGPGLRLSRPHDLGAALARRAHRRGRGGSRHGHASLPRASEGQGDLHQSDRLDLCLDARPLVPGQVRRHARGPALRRGSGARLRGHGRSGLHDQGSGPADQPAADLDDHHPVPRQTRRQSAEGNGVDMLKKTIAAAVFAASLGAAGGSAQAADPENTLYMDLTYGRVVIELRPDLAPKTVARMKELTRQHFFDGIVFHRVISGFMAQTGDPTGTGYGGSGQRLPAEFSSAHHVRGTVSMARAQDPNSADSQFFICFVAVPQLDGQYTIWGQVVSGMEFVERIKRGDSDPNGMVAPPQDKILKMQVAADVKQ